MKSIWWLTLAGLVACASPRPGTDYTRNDSRSERKAGHTGVSRTASPDVQRTALVDFAESLIGVGYRYGGDSPARGFDCSGFTCYVMRQAQIQLPRTSHEQARLGRKKEVTRVRPGDLIFFGHGNRVTHVAIVLSRDRNRIDVVHSTSSRGVVRDNILGSDYWRNRTLWAVDLTDL